MFKRFRSPLQEMMEMRAGINRVISINKRMDVIPSPLRIHMKLMDQLNPKHHHGIPSYLRNPRGIYPKGSGLADLIYDRHYLRGHIDFLDRSQPFARPIGIAALRSARPQFPYTHQHDRAISGVFSSSTWIRGKAAWIDEVVPKLSDFAQYPSQAFLDRSRDLDEKLDHVTEHVSDIFQKEDWYILPILLHADFLLPVIILNDLDKDFSSAEKTVIEYMLNHREDILNYTIQRMESLESPREQLNKRISHFTNQFKLACSGEATEGIATFMFSEAEGIFNDFTNQLGLGKGCFYTIDSRKQEKRRNILESIHSKVKQLRPIVQSEYEDDYSEKDLERFEDLREKARLTRNKTNHGEVIYREQRDALKSISFFILTVEYLMALSKVKDMP